MVASARPSAGMSMSRSPGRSGSREKVLCGRPDIVDVVVIEGVIGGQDKPLFHHPVGIGQPSGRDPELDRRNAG